MMFEMIVNEKIMFSFPKKNFDEHSKSICKQLMAKNPRKRLGNSKTSIQDIKAHPYFADVDWDKMANKEITPPYKP